MAFNPPIAFLLTWGCYGLRLHGDARGSVSDGHNEFGQPFRPPDLTLEELRSEQMLEPAFLIDPRQRGCILKSIGDCVTHNNWRLYALNVRTNHIHAVVGAAGDPGTQVGKLKSRASRLLRENELIGTRKRIWAEGGSKKWLFTEAHVDAACEYVTYGQGPPLPVA